MYQEESLTLAHPALGDHRITDPNSSMLPQQISYFWEAEGYANLVEKSLCTCCVATVLGEPFTGRGFISLRPNSEFSYTCRGQFHVS